MGETLAKFWLFASFSETDTTPTKEIKYKKELSGGTPCKIPVLSSVSPHLLDCLRRPNTTKIKERSLEEPLAKFWLFS